MASSPCCSGHCGKSTLLNIIAGLESLSEGTIEIGERDVAGVSLKDRDIAMVFQSYALYPAMTVRGNITFGMECRGVPRKEREEHRASPRCCRSANCSTASQRSSPAASASASRWAGALVRDPLLFLFDEPLSNLDAKLRVDMRTETATNVQRIAATIVYVTHDQIEAMTMASRIAVMNHGEVQQFAAPDTVYNRPANLFVARFRHPADEHGAGAPGAPARRARSRDRRRSRRDPPAAAGAA